MADDHERNFVDDNHALLVGMVFGVMLKAGLEVVPGFDDDGNYTDEITIEIPDQRPLFQDGLLVRLKVLPD